MLNKKTVDDINVCGKRVLVRCDFNVPVKDGVITDENRLVAALPTLKKLIADGGRLILCSHFGKPKEGPEAKYSLAPVAKRLSELLGQEVKFDDEGEVVGPKAVEMANALQNGEVMLLENTRFRKEETKNVESFSKELASLADVYVNDAFGSAHRAHCSTVGVTEFVDTAVVGYLMEKEINFLGNAVENPVRPFAAILGGAKVSDKINVINNLLEKVDILIIGGGMAYTFMKSQGMEIGKSLLEEDKLDYAKEMIEKAKANGVKLLLPVDNLVSKEFSNDAPFRVAEGGMEADEMGLDIGPKTRALFAEALKDAKTVVWNGPMGVFEMSNFAGGTVSVAQTLADLVDATTIIGGGDSAAAVNQLGFGDKMSHISTGGGASLEFLEGKGLPGVDAVNDRTRKKIIAGNWKMNKTPSEAAELVKTLAPIVEPNEKVDVVYCPPFISITTVAGLVKGTDIKVGAENLYVADKGAYTGEISAPMLVDAGCEYVILGHSERRAYFGETDKFINEKVKKAFEYNLKPIICVGETLEQREQGITVDLIRMQTKIALLDVPAEQAKDAVIAYEPVWAIGTGKTATSEQAQEVCHAIRVCLTEMYGEATAQAMRIQYGGSMNAANAAELLAMPDIDGGLIGGAALKPDFATIVNAAKA